MGDLSGIVDMHVHTNPDLRLRRYDDFMLCDEAVKIGAKAVVLKSHLGSTAERAYLCNRYMEKVYGSVNTRVFGSVTMNSSIGGLNAEAVENALRLGAKVVWLPTQSARNHLIRNHKPLDHVVEVVRDGKVVSELYDIFSLVKEYDVTLSSGHMGPEEIFVIAKAAKEAGLKKFVVTHPEWWLVNLSESDMEMLVREYDVFLELCYAQNKGIGAGHGYLLNLERNLETIKRVGYQNVLISSDGGQVENAPWEWALLHYQKYLLSQGLSEKEVFYMNRELPSYLLGL